MNTVELFFRDLVPEAQQEVLKLYGYSSPDDANWDIVPIDILEGPEQG